MTRAPASPLAHCAAVAAGVVAIDLVTKLAAVALLDGRDVPLAGGTWLTTYYNDTFARGLALGPLTTPATLALALLVLALVWRVCAPLARHDAMAPVALGLLAGATVGNAADFLRTGVGAVDFLAVPTAEGAIVFNLADVAAYLGVALLVRTAIVLTGAAVAARRAPAPRGERTVGAEPRAPRHATRELPVALPLFVEQGGAALATEATGGRPAIRPEGRPAIRSDLRLDLGADIAARGAPPESHDTAGARPLHHRTNARMG
jgi:lipoprotein signal peptidase